MALLNPYVIPLFIYTYLNSFNGDIYGAECTGMLIVILQSRFC